MTNQQNPRAVQTPANKLDTARKHFILTMEQLAAQGTRDNPLTALVDEVLPQWVTAGSTPAATSPTRFRFRTGTHIDEENKRARRREIIEEWARRFWLLGTNGEPADWIVAYAEELCQKRSGEWRDGPTRLGHPNVHPGQGFHQLSFPMTDPEPRRGEAFADFRKRARQALAVYLNHLENGPNKAITPKIDDKPSPPDRPRDLEHFRWFLLYQCCKRKLSEIAAASGHRIGNPEDKEFNTIYQAIKRTADLLQIKLRRARA